LRDLDAEVAGGEVRRLPDPRGHAVRVRGAHHRRQAQDPRSERGPALRHRGAGRDAGRRTAGAAHRGGLRDERGGDVAVTTAVLSEQAVRQALQEVLDPELDQPITELGFVARLQVSGTGEVAVDLRLPTYFCAPNFAYLMAADAREAVSAVPGVRQVRVRLLDHFASEEINAGVAADSG